MRRANVRVCPCMAANRLGTNSLLDLVVFGKYAGIKAAEYAKTADFEKLPENAEADSRSQFEAFRNGSGKENAFDISTEMKKVMFDDVGIYRNEKGMAKALEKVKALQERFKEVRATDTGRIFNTELLNMWELGNMLEVAEVVAACALNRKEIARRTFARGLPRARRPGMDEAHAGLEAGRQGEDRLQACRGHEISTKRVINVVRRRSERL